MVQISIVTSMLITAVASAASVAALAVSSRSTFVQGPPINPGMLPSGCQQDCTAIINAVNNCTDTACFCTSENRDSLQSCVQCVYNVFPAPSVVMALQPGIDAFNGNCTSLQPVTLTTTAIATSTSASASTATMK